MSQSQEKFSLGIDADLVDRVFPSEQRRPGGPTGILVTAACAVLTIWTFYMGIFGTAGPIATRAIHLTFVVPLVFLLYPRKRSGGARHLPTLLDWALAALSALSFGWAAWSADRFQWRMAYFEPVGTVDLLAGVLSVILVLEATRRTLGSVILVLAGIFIFYTLTGQYWPGLFNHKSVEFSRLIEHVYLIPEGVFSIIMGIAATFLFTYMAFGVALQVVGGDKFFMNLALALAGRRRGGPAKVAIFSSGFMGMLSGSTVSNVVTTGSITIPLMKRVGFKPHEAGAFEATASLGGALTPPLMGAGVFIMTQFTGVPLSTILLYSIIPAIIYFASLYFYADIRARKYDLAGLPDDELPKLAETLRKGWHLSIPLIVLVTLLVMQFTPFLASTVATIFLLAVSFLRRETRLTWNRFIVLLEGAGRVTLFISVLLASASLVFGTITITGLIVKVTSIILAYSDGSLLLGIILVAAMSYVLGMGLPITASYVIIATLGGSALNELGLSVLAAHLIIFWLSQDSTITPPICMTAFVAAGIAKAKPMRTGFESMLLGKGLYIVPLAFAYTNLLSASLPEVLFDGAVLIGAMAMIPIAVEGHWFRRLKLLERLLAAASCVALMLAAIGEIPTGWIWLIAGLACIIVLVFSQRRRPDYAPAEQP